MATEMLALRAASLAVSAGDVQPNGRSTTCTFKVSMLQPPLKLPEPPLKLYLK
ncbi:hypothetical protein PF005_g29682 [Phytophthora fragariae]|uniref:Uncharacterized protein n=1 Tax=Phytophthora fragariae TaxID=53985 RepID=A0A6A3VN99_9STRA|nr:hypothetical protein PF009_g30012 [Phytophthora fragariae]KAE8960308.1 hypothetical protein PF011_g30142 [Phytophthora fragariae]KAE9062006.1 hypothetical protein PF010_g29587 [Phytophthora fragariae]KAE9063623.1 hypothetical protein PF007_g29489 [Phytophthora fragariae]KAE9071518.1 hypothetical protein PF006_g29133 [Phytophthora fragariae]